MNNKFSVVLQQVLISWSTYVLSCLVFAIVAQWVFNTFVSDLFHIHLAFKNAFGLMLLLKLVIS